ncbi:MAG: glucose-1-phosphate thymidylyltransferase [bacterium]
MKPAEFFDLSSFEHKALFDGVENVWETVARIGEYLERWKDWEIRGEVREGAVIVGKVSIGEGTVVEPTAYIEGPTVIGKNCAVRHGAYVRGKVIAGDGCVIGHATEVKNSIFLNGAKAAHFAYVGDSILGAGVNLGAGAKLANFKIQAGRPNIDVAKGGEKFQTGQRKLGAILGDGVELGCNSVTAPGTLVGPGSMVYPCTSIRGYIPPRSIVKMKQSFETVERED